MNIGLLCLTFWAVFGILGWAWLGWSAIHAPHEPPGQDWG